MRKKYSTVFFDAGGVLFPSPVKALDAHFTSKGIPKELLTHVLGGTAYRSSSSPWALLERGEIPFDAFCRRLQSAVGGTASQLSVTEMLADMHKHAARVLPDMLTLLHELKKRKYQVAVVTNNWEGSFDSTDIDRVKSAVDMLVESYKVGCRKPEPEIYQTALRHAQERAERCVFVDDLGSNLAIPRRMGMATLRFDPADCHRSTQLLQETLGEDGLVPFLAPQGSVPVPSRLSLDTAALRNDVPHLFAGSRSIDVRYFTGGQSNPTYFLHTDNSGDFVLRRKPPGQLLRGAHMIEREALLYQALQGRGVPVPEVVHNHTSNAAPSGLSYYIMRYLPGNVFRNPALPGVPTSQRRQLFLSAIDALAALHRVDPLQDVVLKTLGKPEGSVSRSLTTWAKQYSSGNDAVAAKFADKVLRSPAFETLVEELPKLLPTGADSGKSPAVLHGDFKLDNLIFQHTKVAAMVDLELSTLGNRWTDVGYFLMWYTLPNRLVGLDDVDTLNLGIPSPDEVLRRYVVSSGLPADAVPSAKELTFYVALALYKLSGILHGVYCRAVGGNASASNALHLGKECTTVAAVALSVLTHGLPWSPVEGPAKQRDIRRSTIYSTTRSQAVCAMVSRFMEENVLPEENVLLGPSLVSHKAMALLRAKARDQGLVNYFLPRHRDESAEHGMTLTDYAPVCEIMGRSLAAPEVFNCNAPDTGNMEILHLFGTERQKEQWLKPLLDGTYRSAFAMTEPDVASSDATNIQLRIDKDETHYILNGTKWWITGALHPDCKVLLVMGKTDPSAEKHHQQSIVLVPTAAAGVRMNRGLTVFGYDDASHGGHAEISFDNVRVPHENVILREGAGFEIAQRRLGPGRVHHCMRLIGAASRALELMVSRAGQRNSFGQRMSKHDIVLRDIAECHTRLEQARHLTLHAAWEIERKGTKAAMDAIAAIKIVVPGMAQSVIDTSIQLHGACGLSQDTALAKLFAAARSLRIADGPDDVHLLQLGRRLVARGNQR